MPRTKVESTGAWVLVLASGGSFTITNRGAGRLLISDTNGAGADDTALAIDRTDKIGRAMRLSWGTSPVYIKHTGASAWTVITDTATGGEARLLDGAGNAIDSTAGALHVDTGGGGPADVNISDTAGDPLTSTGGSLDVDIGTPVVDVLLNDGAGNPIGSLRGALTVHAESVHSNLVNAHFMKENAATEAVGSNIAAGVTVIPVASTTGFSVGNSVIIKYADGTVPEHHYILTAVAADTSLTLDGPTGYAYTTADTVEKVEVEMAVSGGSLSAPLAYEVAPGPGEVWHITRVLISITDGEEQDDSKFGGIATLTNGVVVRMVVGGQVTNLTNWKDNGDMMADMYDVVYSDDGKNGEYGTHGRWTFTKMGSAISLDGDAGDKIELLIQDDLSDLTHFVMKAQGHPED